jgi:urea transport system substrate-binding protein
MHNKYTVIIITCIIIIFFLINKNDKKIIDIGVLFTINGGAMAENEKILYNILNENINIFNTAQNKIYLRKHEFNPQSDTQLYIKGAEYLCNQDVALIFGCWRSIDRKAIIPTINKYNNLLCYPLQYEGSECSSNIFYFGACPNQQIDFGIEYGIKNISDQIVLIGSDYVFPRSANKIIKEHIKNMNAVLLDEIYISMTETQFDIIIDKILKYFVDKPILIINTINGISNKYFYKTLYEKFMGMQRNKNTILSEIIPVLSFSVTETQIQDYDIKWMFGHYFVWNYAQMDRSFKPFIEDGYARNPYICNQLLKNFYNSNYVIGDPEYHCFLSFLFFVEFLERHKSSFDAKTIRNAYINDAYHYVLTPTGYLDLNENNHLSQHVYILKCNKLKRFMPIYKTSVEIHPEPWFNKYEQKNNNQYMCDTKTFLGMQYKTLQNNFFNT